MAFGGLERQISQGNGSFFLFIVMPLVWTNFRLYGTSIMSMGGERYVQSKCGECLLNIFLYGNGMWFSLGGVRTFSLVQAGPLPCSCPL